MWKYWNSLDTEEDDVVGSNVDKDILPNIRREWPTPPLHEMFPLRLRDKSRQGLLLTQKADHMFWGRFSEFWYQASGEPRSQRVVPGNHFKTKSHVINSSTIFDAIGLLHPLFDPKYLSFLFVFCFPDSSRLSGRPVFLKTRVCSQNVQRYELKSWLKPYQCLCWTLVTGHWSTQMIIKSNFNYFFLLFSMIPL